MPHYKAKMNQIRFRLGFRPRPHWGSLQSSPEALAGLGVLLLRLEGGKGRGRERRKGEGSGGKRRWKRRRSEDPSRTPPTFLTD